MADMGFGGFFGGAGGMNKSYAQAMLDRLRAGKKVMFHDKPGGMEAKVQAAANAGQINSLDDVMRIMDEHYGNTLSSSPGRTRTSASGTQKPLADRARQLAERWARLKPTLGIDKALEQAQRELTLLGTPPSLADIGAARGMLQTQSVAAPWPAQAPEAPQADGWPRLAPGESPTRLPGAAPAASGDASSPESGSQSSAEPTASPTAPQTPNPSQRTASASAPSWGTPAPSLAPQRPSATPWPQSMQGERSPNLPSAAASGPAPSAPAAKPWPDSLATPRTPEVRNPLGIVTDFIRNWSKPPEEFNLNAGQRSALRERAPQADWPEGAPPAPGAAAWPGSMPGGPPPGPGGGVPPGGAPPGGGKAGGSLSQVLEELRRALSGGQRAPLVDRWVPGAINLPPIGSPLDMSNAQEGFPQASPSVNASSAGGLRGAGGWGFGSRSPAGETANNFLEPGRRDPR